MEYVTRCGEDVPRVGVGTWQMDPSTAYQSVAAALDRGYRHVDTAQLYENERSVGDAIQDADVDRDEVFLTTKIDPTQRAFDEMVASVEESVDRLQVGQLDLLLIHWPNPLADLETVMAALDTAADRGLTRHIGVSNFSKERLKRAQRHAETPIFTDQVLFNPWWTQRELLSYCQSEGIVLTAYSPLGNGGAIGDDLLAEIGSRYGKTGPQTAIRWATQHEQVITIPMSTSPEHLGENIDIFDFLLTREEHDRITRPSYIETAKNVVRGAIGN